MSVTIVSYVLLGCEVTGKLHRERVRPACEHEFDRTQFPFCARCGKPSTLTEVFPIEAWDEDETITLNDREKIDVVGLYSLVDQRPRKGAKRHFAGRVLSKICEWEGCQPSVLEALLGVPPRGTGADQDAVHTVRTALESIGLYDEGSFRTHHLLYVSR